MNFYTVISGTMCTGPACELYKPPTVLDTPFPLFCIVRTSVGNGAPPLPWATLAPGEILGPRALVISTISEVSENTLLVFQPPENKGGHESGREIPSGISGF